MADGTLTKQIGDLYLSKDYSDVIIVIGGTELPAHRNILSQRCPYFKTMFASGMIESTSKRIELHETPINGFKSVLKWIYTDEIEFTQMSTALEVLWLADMYELIDLLMLSAQFIAANCDVDNICWILNNVIFTSLSIFNDYLTEIVRINSFDILAHETFSTLSKDALEALLKDCVEYVTNIEILKAFVRWMQANPYQSMHFPELLKLIPLNSINFGELLSIVPADQISANVLADVAREQKSMYETGVVTGVNFAVPKYGFKLNGNLMNYLSMESIQQYTAYNTENVVIDLGQCFMLNCFCLEAIGTCSKEISDSINVFVSTDNANWTNIGQLEEFQNVKDSGDEYAICCAFKDHVVRFISVNGNASLNEVVHLNTIFAGYLNLQSR